MKLRFLFGALVCVLLAVVQAAAAAVGNLQVFEGDVRVVTSAGEQAARSGMELNEGDTVKSGANAWALLAMSDGASLTLRPDTQLKIDIYRYDIAANSRDNSSALSLVKGALRAITGYIGRGNRDGYRINTPTATIGVRGTDHEPAYFPPPENGEKMDHEPGTYDKVNEGESFIRNPRGEVAVKPGQHAFVHHNGRVAPRLLARAPAFYKRHAEFDRRAEAHRAEFHRTFEERHQKRLQEFRQRGITPGARAEGKAAARDAAGRETVTEKAEAHAGEPQTRQEKRREKAEQRREERQAAQEQHKQQQAEEKKKKREADREARREQKKEQEKAAGNHEEKHHPR